MDYPIGIIIGLLHFSEELDSIKERTTRVLVPSHYKLDQDFDDLAEGNTLRGSGSHGTRIPKNTHNLLETLSCMTCDVEQARKHLEPEENMALAIKYGPYDLTQTPEIGELAETALQKMYSFLNYGYLPK